MVKRIPNETIIHDYEGEAHRHTADFGELLR